MHVCMQYIFSELNAARVATTGRLWENLPPNSVPLIVIMTLNCRSMELAALGARAKSQWVVVFQTANTTATPVETTGAPPLGLVACVHICS